MDIKQILTADVLDIIFEGRNKAYGAYELRKTYNKRFLTALLSSAVFIILMYAGYRLAKDSSHETIPFNVKDIDLVAVREKEIEEREIIPPKQKEIQQVKTVKLTTPLIVTSKNVPIHEMPPAQHDVEDARISFANIAGEMDSDIIAPPKGDENKGIIALPKKEEEDPDRIFIKVEIESEYPGGTGSWIRFLLKNLRNYPEEAMEKGVEGTVVVQFVVDREGNVSNVEALTGPGELRMAAVTVIKKSGKWIPAQQNGSKVKSYKKQPVSFRLGE